MTDSIERIADEMDEAATKPQAAMQLLGHLYRVAHFDEAAARPWESAGTVFVSEPAPIEGRRGVIQYVNVYAALQPATSGETP